MYSQYVLVSTAFTLTAGVACCECVKRVSNLTPLASSWLMLVMSVLSVCCMIFKSW